MKNHKLFKWLCKFMFTGFLWLIFTMQVNAQSKTITGTVSGINNQDPLPGVSVLIKGTNKGTVTNLEGKFSIEVPDNNSTLVFSFVGHVSQEVLVGSKTNLNIVLEEDITSMDEVVVIGYGSIKKEDLTGSVSVVSSEELKRTPVNNVSKAIQGRASGVVVFQSGAPGGGVNMRVRGIGSINLDPDPLYVVDGIVGADINAFSPEDIESVSILKDASASAIYGANAANGVVVVTTKRGADTRGSKITFSASIGFNQIAKDFNLMNADEYASFYNSIYEEDGVIPHVAYSDEFRQQYYHGNWHEGTDWQNEILQNNMNQNYYLNISNGSENSNYSISVNYFDEEGLLLNSSSNRFNLRANSDFRIGKYIKIGESLNITRKKSQDPNNSAWGMALESSPLMNVYNEDNKEGYEGAQIPFSYTTSSGDIDVADNTGGNDKFNPAGILAIPDNSNIYDNVLADVYIEINPFITGVTYKSSFSANAYINETHGWTPEYDMGARSIGNAKLSNSFSKGHIYSVKNQLNYNISPGLHSIGLTAVHHLRVGFDRNLSASASDYPYEQLPVISQAVAKEAAGGEGEHSQLSYIGRLIYSFNSKYLIKASLRRDGSSNFAPGLRWGTFPAFSAAWKINEDFLPHVKEINMLKLRFGWGKTGNSDIGSFQFQTNLGAPHYFSPVFGLAPEEAYAINELWNTGNPVIQWEAAEMTNIAIDLNAFGNRIQFTGEYYIKKQNDLLMEVPISLIHGKGLTWSPAFPWVNIANIENRGFDFDIRYSKMEGVFNYRVYANLSTVENKVISIPSSIIQDNNLTREGYPIGSIYGYVADGIIQESDFDEEGNYLYPKTIGVTPSPGDIKFKDLNQDGKIDDTDRTLIGKPIPDYTYSFGFDLYFRNFDFSAFFYGVQNVQILNTMRSRVESFEAQEMDHNKSADWAANYYGRNGIPSTEYVRADINDENRNSRGSSWWVDEASFLRVKDVQLGYSLQKNILDRIGVNSARIYMSGMNLFTFTNYKGYDPESPLNSSDPTTPAVDNNKYPIPKVYTFGVQLIF